MTSVISQRRAREIARTREDILEAAARAFARSGYKSATMADIAREAGYTAASLYGYFSSKEEIFRGLFERIRNEIEAARPAFPEGLTLRQKLELLLRKHLEVAQRHRAVFQVFHLSGETTGFCSADEEGLSRAELMARDFEAFFRIEAKPGELGDWDPAHAALAFAGMAHVFFVHWLRSPDSSPIGDGTSRFLDLFFHGVLGPRGS